MAATIVIQEVSGVGDIANERVVIRSDRGRFISLAGWELRDTDGNVYTFPDYRLFPGARVTIFTRSGSDTPIALFWNLEQAVWAPGDMATVVDTTGTVVTVREIRK